MMKTFLSSYIFIRFIVAAILVLSPIAPETVLAVIKIPELLAGWRFEDPSTVTVVDFSGNGYDGSKTGSPSIVAGKFGNGLITDSAHYVTTSAAIGNFGTSDFSISVWVITTANTRTSVVSKRLTCGDESFWEITIRPGTGFPAFEVDQDVSGTNYIFLQGTVAVNDGQWHHLVAVRSSNNLYLYVDGQLDNSGSAAGSANLSNAATVAFGRDIGACVSSLATIDEVRIYNRVLNLSEIR